MAIEAGPQLLPREYTGQTGARVAFFGGRERSPESVLLVSIRDAARVIGVLSVQSFAARAYNSKSLDTLQSLADHCGGAMERIRADEALDVAMERLNHLLRESPAVIYSPKPDAGPGDSGR